MFILAKGLDITIKVLIGSAVFGYLVAFVAGFASLSRYGIIRKVTAVFVEFFRGTSLIVQLFWIYFVLPLPDIWTGIVAISLNYGAYMSEIVRGAIVAVPKGQTEASVALNMTPFQRMRLVILPQAVRMMLPEFGNYLIQMLKATSLVSLIGLADITFQAELHRSVNLNLGLQIFFLLLVMYFLLALPLIGVTRWLERISSKGVASR